MTTSIFRSLSAGMVCAALLLGCGGGSDSRAGSELPTATIGASADGAPVASEIPVDAGSTVTLTARDSTTPTGTLSYQWSLLRQPDGSAAAIDDPLAADARFVPEIPGEYLIGLRVDNGLGNASTQLLVMVTSTLPTALVTHAEQTTLVGQVQLDGRASLPPSEGDATRLRYQWQLVSVPPGSTLTGITAAEAGLSQPRFRTDVAGRYEAELQVSYEGRSGRSPARAVVHAVAPHQTPVAVIKPVNAEPYERGQTIRLHGDDSTRGSGTAALQYRWTVVGVAPGGAQAFYDPPTVNNTDQREVAFVPKRAGAYRATLTVYDGISLSATATVTLNVVKPAGAANLPPVAVIEHLYGQNTFEVEWGAAQTLTSAAYDPDSAAATGLVREWTMLRPLGRESDLTITSPTLARFTAGLEPPVDGHVEYEFQLRVQDEHGAWSEPVRQVYRILRGANRTPTAIASVTSGLPTVMAGRDVVLSGELSSDPDNNRLDYRWTLVDRPSGSRAELRNADQIRPSFTADVAGNYIVELLVTDEHGSRSLAPSRLNVFAKSVNHAPQARPSTVLRFTEEQPFVIDMLQADALIQSTTNTRGDEYRSIQYASSAYDPDGDPLQLLWTMTESPSADALGWYSGHLAQCPVGGPALIVLPGGGFINNPWTPKRMAEQLPAREWTDCRDGVLEFAPTIPGRYEFNLQVSDGSEDIGPFGFTLNATTRDQYPGLLFEDLQQGEVSSSAPPTRQVTFPIEADSGDGRRPLQFYRLSIDQQRGSTITVRSYRLTASGGDYTVTNLAATSVHPDFQAIFVNLADGQRIRRGESVDFQLAFVVPAADRTLPSGDDYAAIGRGLQWSFAIAEKPGWTYTSAIAHFVP